MEKQLLFCGSGFNNIYPKINKVLFNQILENGGLIISEYPPDSPPLRHHFLERNRIVAALANGIIIVEAKENSGSMTTAKHAKSIQRDLFVFPGSCLNLNYSGSNKLLVDGAKCILSYKDILKNYKILEVDKLKNEKEKITVPKEYIDVYKVLSFKPKSINQIAIELKMPISILNSKLTIMEMEGFIKCFPGKKFSKSY